MPEIEITEDQYEYLEALREDIQQDVVGKYAHVRMVDAVQYLIDNHEGEINATVTAPSAGPDVSAENAPAADPVEESSEDEADDDATDDDDVDAEDDADSNAEESQDAEDGDEAAEDEADADEESEDDADAEDSGGTTSSPPMAAAAGGDDDGMLSAMMALMDTHDDKWDEASGDTGYEVELPDGSTENANTQDDVRALLFKHYE